MNVPGMIFEGIAEKAKELVQDTKEYWMWEKIFVNAGLWVATYEHDGTEENSIREIAFSEENMKKLAKKMRETDDFCFEKDLKRNVLSVLEQSCMEKNNQERCMTQFMQIIIGDIKRVWPDIIERSYSMEIRDNTLSILGNQRIQSIENERVVNTLQEIQYTVKNIEQNYQQSSNRIDVFKDKIAEDVVDEWYLKTLWNNGFPKNPEREQEIALEALELWREERKSYPGWYFLPYHMHRKLWGKTRRYEYLIRPNILSSESELDLCYEYVWRCETGKMIYSMSLQQNVYKIWNKHLPETDDKERKIDNWFYIGTVLLREYREDGSYKEWKKVFDCLRVYQDKCLYGKEILNVEETKCAFRQFKMNKVRRLCNKYDLPKEAYVLRLQMIGLEAEYGNTEDALKHIRELKADLVKVEPISDDMQERVHRNSLYAILLRVESLLQQGGAFKKREYEKHQEQINIILNQVEKGKKYFDWEAQIASIESSLLEWHVKKHEEKHPFELGIETITIMSSENICEDSYYLYRMVDAMAIPLISDCVNLLGRLEKVWFEALQELNPQLALFMMLRGSKKDAVKICYNRSNMMLMKPEEVAFQIDYIKDVLLENMEEMAELTSVYGGGVCKELQSNLPEIMIRCMSRCPEDMQCEILLMLGKVMEIPGLTMNFQLGYFVQGILRQISEKNKMKMLGQMLRTIIVEHKERRGKPVDLFDFYFQKEQLTQYYHLCKIDSGVIENLFYDNDDSLYVWRTKIARLMTLKHIGKLEQEQELALTDKIWSRLNQYQLPDLPNYYLWNYMNLSYGDKCIPVLSVKVCLLEKGMMALYEKEEGCQITMGSIRYLDEVITASNYLEIDFWTVEEVENIYQDAIRYWEIVKRKLVRDISSLCKKEYETRANKMFHMMAEVYKSISGKISENMQVQIQQVLEEAQEIGMEVCGLKVLFLAESQKKEFVEGLIEHFYSEEEHAIVDALRAAYSFIEKYPYEELSQYLLKEMISMLRSGKEPGLVYVINILHNLLYTKNPSFLENEIKAVDCFLILLEKKTRYENHMESENQIKRAALIRRACVSLSYQISLRENAVVKYPGVRWWQEICDGEEFADVKNEMLV